jgi:hypothetical protein
MELELPAAHRVADEAVRGREAPRVRDHHHRAGLPLRLGELRRALERQRGGNLDQARLARGGREQALLDVHAGGGGENDRIDVAPGKAGVKTRMRPWNLPPSRECGAGVRVAVAERRDLHVGHGGQFLHVRFAHGPFAGETDADRRRPARAHDSMATFDFSHCKTLQVNSSGASK